MEAATYSRIPVSNHCYTAEEMIAVAQDHINECHFDMARECAQHARWVTNAMERTGRNARWDVRQERIIFA